METLKKVLILLSLTQLLIACGAGSEDRAKPGDLAVKEEKPPSVREIRDQLNKEGYQTFDYVDEKTGDTILMQQYFMVFLKKGSGGPLSESEIDSLQGLHLAHLGRMYEEGYADISGPFGDDGEIRGITIYNTPTLAIADSLARLDPLVRSGRLQIEVHPWWAAKGFSLR